MEMKVVNEVELGQISDGLIDVNIMDYVTMQTEQTDKTPINDNPNETEKEDQAEMLKMTEDERRQMATWNATQQEYPRDACVPQLVALQARITPEAVALVVGDQVISYQELNRRANQLAHHLQALGVRPNVLVGICVERSFDMVVGLLGIFKAGGAYLPLDPSYPPDRLAFMMHDAQVPLLVTQNHLTSRLPTEGTKVVCLDTQADILVQQRITEPTLVASADDLAYVIYTSGSTGQPKGVQITHASLLNLVFWHQRAFDVTSSDHATQIASLAFDATGWELWPYLTCGASVHLIEEDTRLSDVLVLDWLVKQKITITFLPTVLAERLLQLDWPATTSLRLLLTGADTLHVYPSPDLPFALIN